MSRKIGKEMREVQQLLHRKYELKKEQQSEKLTQVQVHVLMYIHRHDGQVFQKDIEQHLKVRRSTASQILNVLERESYVERMRLESDARMKEIVVTDKTLALIDSMERHMKETESMLRVNISDNDMETFFKVIDQIKENLK
ncbi:MAG: MarR family transcriptional regulator [Erysipelothrix sp.]|nr:MarR family transcriptional regulator [Erysipelothrix sp.]